MTKYVFASYDKKHWRLKERFSSLWNPDSGDNRIECLNLARSGFLDNVMLGVIKEQLRKSQLRLLFASHESYISDFETTFILVEASELGLPVKIISKSSEKEWRLALDGAGISSLVEIYQVLTGKEIGLKKTPDEVVVRKWSDGLNQKAALRVGSSRNKRQGSLPMKSRSR